MEIDLSAILDLAGSNPFMSCPWAMSFSLFLKIVLFPLPFGVQFENQEISFKSSYGSFLSLNFLIHKMGIMILCHQLREELAQWDIK